jgi:hypothetical protein
VPSSVNSSSHRYTLLASRASGNLTEGVGGYRPSKVLVDGGEVRLDCGEVCLEVRLDCGEVRLDCGEVRLDCGEVRLDDKEPAEAHGTNSGGLPAAPAKGGLRCAETGLEADAATEHFSVESCFFLLSSFFLSSCFCASQ